ncbi:hypothetical protein V9L05_20045 [Bernardetia sp. Wsw4-3y2]|uniref:hypothetical protein n=1 Tax=Bernardetia sp. Wsw4-3y2 TaxID=3127471 RepID=UPI0030D1BE53
MNAEYLKDLGVYLVAGFGYANSDLSDLLALKNTLVSELYTCESYSPKQPEFWFEVETDKKTLFDKYVKPTFLIIENVDLDINMRSDLILHNIFLERIRLKRPTFLHISDVDTSELTYSSVRTIKPYLADIVVPEP